MLQKFKDLHPKIELWLEPGRFLVATSGVLLAKVTQLKNKDEYYYVGINTGFNTLIRPILYGAYHVDTFQKKKKKEEIFLTSFIFYLVYLQFISIR